MDSAPRASRKTCPAGSCNLSGAKGGPKREREIAAAWLHEQGAVYVRAVLGMRSGWWLDGVFLGSRSVEAEENLCESRGKKLWKELEDLGAIGPFCG